jgi:hypothetical protein
MDTATTTTTTATAERVETLLWSRLARDIFYATQEKLLLLLIMAKVCGARFP